MMSQLSELQYTLKSLRFGETAGQISHLLKQAEINDAIFNILNECHEKLNKESVKKRKLNDTLNGQHFRLIKR